MCKIRGNAKPGRPMPLESGLNGNGYSNRTGLFGLLWKLLALASIFFAGCSQPAKPPPPVVAETPNYLNAGDVVKITFPAAPELNQSQKIGTDGSLSLPLVGEVHAAGKRPRDLQTELANLYKRQLQDNEVLVALETRAVPVVVSGAVQKPGKIVFERPATLLEAIMEAGGFTPEADLKKVAVIRIVKGNTTRRLSVSDRSFAGSRPRQSTSPMAMKFTSLRSY